LISEIDGDVFNYNVERYRKLEKSHLITLNLEAKGNFASLECVTNSSGIKIVQESQLRSESIDLTKIQNKIEENKIKQTVELDTVENEWYALEKIVYVAKDTKDARTDYPTYTELLTASKEEWETLWEKASIEVEGDMMSQKMLNLHTYHMLTSGSPKGNKELDASITARGLHGEAYRGHIFWDELFILPFFMLHFPDTAKELLMYRYNRLEMAKVLAKEEGYEGAMYPWQSGLDGSEQSQKLHLNPLSGKWKEDHSRRQRHVSLAIAYNVWMYYLQTEDEAFLKSYGLEMLFEISQFWLSLATYDDQTNRYSINGVMGPDEFHEAYSDREKGGLDNNAYTNLMVAWMFGVMTELKSMYPLETSLDWQKVEKMRKSLQLDINSEGIIAQFDGYFDLEEIDWTTYREKYGNIYRMDRILNAEGKTADDFKVAKQADSLMIFYNLPEETVTNLLSDLSYSLPDDYVKKNLLYYLERTSHGSTLSRVVHSQLAEMVNNRELAWELYQEALYSDYRDIQGGTTAEGVHTGVMASTLSITLTAFAGLDIRGEKVKFNPHLPEQWQSLSFSFQNKGCEFSVYLNHDTLEITSDKNCVIKVTDRLVELKANKTQIISY
ncbi:glycosyl hydrolase family 65 protein, partial [Vagococcus sp.]|uniref:glycosyl hydrolase family 65 protein n=1 Tax=Vagococcus sp. TaxID=1933889 RepID=UPI002FC7873C